MSKITIKADFVNILKTGEKNKLKIYYIYFFTEFLTEI